MLSIFIGLLLFHPLLALAADVEPCPNSKLLVLWSLIFLLIYFSQIALAVRVLTGVAFADFRATMPIAPRTGWMGLGLW